MVMVTEEEKAAIWAAIGDVDDEVEVLQNSLAALGVYGPHRTTQLTSPIIKSGAVKYNSGTGWWMGRDDGTPKFFIGNSGGNKLTWDGTTLGITGSITVSGGDAFSKTNDDLDDVTDGTSYKRVPSTSISAGVIIVAGLASAVTDRMFQSSTYKTNVEAWAHASDVTLIDGGDIYANSIVVAGLNSAVTDRMFADSTTKTNMEGWRHGTDVTKIDGGDIYTNTVTATQISVANLSALNADMGTLTAGTINMFTGTWDTDATGFRLNATEICGQNAGTDQVTIAASTGKLTVAAGKVILDADGIQLRGDNRLEFNPDAGPEGIHPTYLRYHSSALEVYREDEQSTLRLTAATTNAGNYDAGISMTPTGTGGTIIQSASGFSLRFYPGSVSPLMTLDTSGILAVDTINEITAAAGVTIDSVLLKDGEVDGVVVDAHKDRHDPQDGADPLDTANAASIAGVQAAGTGTAHSLARSDHVHGIAHSIANNALVTVDDAAAADNEYAKFTASGLEGRTYANVRSDINVADGADVTANNAPQAHKASHQNTGGDEISVAGLSGLLADDQHVLDAEVIAAVEAETTLEFDAATTISTAVGNLTLSPVTGSLLLATGAVTSTFLYFKNDNDGPYGIRIYAYHDTTSLAPTDLPFQIQVATRDTHADHHEIACGNFRMKVADNTDGSEDTEWWWATILNGTETDVMYLTSPGVLAVHASGVGTAAQVDEFDDYDDALILRQGISLHQSELLADIGVFSQQQDGRYFMNVQPMVYLLAGGVYQNRAKIDALEQKLQQLEASHVRLLE